MLSQFFRKEMTSPVDSEIDAVLHEMHAKGVNSEEYSKYMNYLERLDKIKAKERRAPVSRDTMVMTIGNLAGILLIVAYEQKHVMTSKGFNQLIRPKGLGS